MRIQHQFLWFCLVTWVFSGVLGCTTGTAPANHPETSLVTGTVTLDGHPVERAIVRFQLTDGSRVAVGETDSKGIYQLSSFTANDGAVSGDYEITIIQYSVPPADFPQPKGEDDPDFVEFVPKNLLPSKYENPATSGLRATVKSESNQIDFALRKSP